MTLWDDFIENFNIAYKNTVDMYNTALNNTVNYFNNLFNAFLEKMMGVKKEHLKPEEMPPLFDYQREAIAFIVSNWRKKINTLCALGVGTGKTRVACGIISTYFSTDVSPRVQGYALVCCPTAGVRDTAWLNTLKDYNLTVLTLEGEELKMVKDEDEELFSIHDLTVCLITYNNFIKYIDYFVKDPPFFLFLDEYHTLTNNSSKSNQHYREAIMKMPIGPRLGLTATPLVNNENESVLAYGLLNDVDMVREFRSANKAERKSLVEQVKEKHFMFFHNQESFKPYPSSEWVVSIPLCKEHFDNYLAVKKECGPNSMTIRHQVGKLSISPALIKKNRLLKLNCTAETGKIIALKSIISHLPDSDKIVICDNQKETLEFIMYELDFMQPLKPLKYFGGSKLEYKNNLNSFTANPEHRALLTTRQKGGESINLQVANHFVLLNIWFTPKDITQTIGRINRTGQTKPTYAYIFGNNICTFIEDRLPIDKNLRKIDVLEEDRISYEMIGKKKEMCEKWNIDVNLNWPSFIDFRNYDTFEDDFNLFLERIMKEAPKIAFDGMNEEINNQTKNYQDREVENQTLNTAFLSHDITSDVSEEEEIEVPDDIDDPGVDGPYLLSDWDVEAPDVPKASSDMRGKVIKLKKKSNSTIQKANSDFVPQGRKVEPIPKTVPQTALLSDMKQDAPKE